MEDAGRAGIAKAVMRDKVERAIEGLSEDEVDRRLLVDHDARRLLALVRKKLKTGKDVIAAPGGDGAAGEGEEAEQVDLMEVLKRSLEQEEEEEEEQQARRHPAKGRSRAGGRRR